jgi:hypothetical protein
MRNFLSALVLVVGLAVAPLTAHAAPVSYDLTLTNVIGNVPGGTGSFTIDAPPSGFVDAFYQNGAPGSALTNLSFNIGGDTFTLANSIGNASVDFFLGNLFSVNYVGSLNNSITISLTSGLLGYSYFDAFDREISTGVISASRSTAVTPEPSTLLLFSTGALGFAAFGARKFVA